MIAERQMGINARTLKRLNQRGEVPIVSPLPISKRQITVDQHACRLPRSTHQLGDHLAKVARNGRVFGVLFTDVGVIEQVNQIRLDSHRFRRLGSSPVHQHAGAGSFQESSSILRGKMNWHGPCRL